MKVETVEESEMTKRQEEIIEVALELIAGKGMGSLTIRNIAREIGVTEPAIYRHFDSKYAILDAMLDKFTAMSSGVLDSIGTSGASGMEKIGNFLQDRYRRFAGNPKLAKVMFSEEIFQDDARLAGKVLAIMHSHREVICGYIEESVRAGEIRDDVDPASLFRIIFGPMRLLVKQWCLSGFAFDLVAEGEKLWCVEKKLIEKGK